MPDPILGIDLGTSNCSVAVVNDHGLPVVLADSKGRKVVPSIVSFHPSGEVLVGADAKHRRQNDPRNTVFSVKRIMGRSYSAKEIAEAKHRSPFAIYKGENDQPLIITRAGKFTPQEISAVILHHMRGIAEAALRRPVERAVITVPANFNEAQRQATAAAAEIAGVVAVRLLNEPTAAALAYAHGRTQKGTIAVYDFGGGTFDVTVLRVADNVYEVLGTAGDTFLGGDDIDNRLVEHEVKQFLDLHRIDLRSDQQVLERLRATAEQVKCELSSKTRAVVTAEGIAAGAGGAPIDLTCALSRVEFVGLIKDIVSRSFPIVDEALRLAGLAPQQVDEVILVGGTTRIPYVRERVAEYFGRPPRTDLDPEQAVALGAAIQAAGIAALLDRQSPGPPSVSLPLPAPPPAAARPALPAAAPTPGPARGPVVDSAPHAPLLDDEDLVTEVGEDDVDLNAPLPSAPARAPAPVLMEVTPQGLSIATVSGFCEVVVKRNAQIPIDATREFTTARDDQDTVEILVLAGESRRIDENLLLGRLVLEGLPAKPRGEARIAVTFGISLDGILEVNARDLGTGHVRSARIELRGALSAEDMDAARERLRLLRAT